MNATQTKRKVPADIQAEKSVLGAMLISKDAVVTAIENLKPEAFYMEKHQVIFSSIAGMFDETSAIDVVTLAHKLRKEGHYEAIGGAIYLDELMEFITSPGNTEYHCQIINDKYMLRELINICDEIYDDAYSQSYSADEIMDHSESKIFTLSEYRIRKGFKHVKEMVDDSLLELENILDNKIPEGTVKSGFLDLDSVLNGFHSGDMVILAARPSVGKTAFSLNLAMNAAIRENKVVGIFTLEMSANDVIKRMLSAIGNVDVSKLKKGFLNKQETISNLVEASRILTNAPIYVDDSAKLNVLEMRAKARRLAKEHGLDMLVIDYLQLMESHDRRRNLSREQEVSHISRSLKALAKELEIPVVALAQLSRSPEQRTDKKPRLSDLRESGSIEQDADVVMFLYREDYYDKENVEVQDKVEVIVAKHRNGETGTVPLIFMKSIQKFENAEADYYSDEYTEG